MFPSKKKILGHMGPILGNTSHPLMGQAHTAVFQDRTMFKQNFSLNLKRINLRKVFYIFL